MHPISNYNSHPDFHISNALPEAYCGYCLGGQLVFRMMNNEGMAIFQEYVHEHFIISYYHADFSRPVQIKAIQEATILKAIIAIRNTLSISIKGMEKLNLRQGQFALLHAKKTELLIGFSGKDCQAIELSLSEEFIKEAMPYFPKLNLLICKPGPSNTFVFHPPGNQAGPMLFDLVREILKAEYDQPIRKWYFEQKVKECLLLLMMETTRPNIHCSKLTASERELILAIGKVLTEQPDKKFPIIQLARTSKMNEMKLKMGFKQLFGQGIYEYQLAARMKEAQRLLKETDLSTKVIAGMVGYSLTTSFITKFRRHFGYPPSQAKRSRY